jgi:hypothetical protein
MMVLCKSPALEPAPPLLEHLFIYFRSSRLEQLGRILMSFLFFVFLQKERNTVTV